MGQLVLRFIKISWIFIFQICFHWQVNEWATFAAGRILLRSKMKHSLKSCLTYVCRSCKRIWRGISSWIFVCQDCSFGREQLVLRKPLERQVKFVFFRSTNGWFSGNSVAFCHETWVDKSVSGRAVIYFGFFTARGLSFWPRITSQLEVLEWRKFQILIYEKEIFNKGFVVFFQDKKLH